MSTFQKIILHATCDTGFVNNSEVWRGSNLLCAISVIFYDEDKFLFVVLMGFDMKPILSSWYMIMNESRYAFSTLRYKDCGTTWTNNPIIVEDGYHPNECALCKNLGNCDFLKYRGWKHVVSIWHISFAIGLYPWYVSMCWYKIVTYNIYSSWWLLICYMQ